MIGLVSLCQLNWAYSKVTSPTGRRPKKADRRPKKLDAPDPKMFPPEQYPHLYQPGAVDALRVKRLTSECEALREKNKDLDRRLRQSQAEIQKLLEQVRALEVMGDMQAKQISRLIDELRIAATPLQTPAE
ncbi:MAG TPA: hypothetical protein DCP31_10195 [Cyanobacteria bacterium UBA8543]|nr:hypothetical protein [Cyanobacteria bacterium UBA8543]